MAYIRLVHPSEYDSVLGEFTDLAFKKSSGSGMSVIERACAEAASGGVICAHIAQFYAGIAGDPVVFNARRPYHPGFYRCNWRFLPKRNRRPFRK